MIEIHIFTQEGIEIIDSTPEAEIRILNMQYLEERYKRQKQREIYYKQNVLYNIIHKIMMIFNI